jgi:hypothetical protein
VCAARRLQDACTPLHVVARNPSRARARATVVELLLSKGADPAAVDKVCGLRQC